MNQTSCVRCGQYGVRDGLDHEPCEPELESRMQEMAEEFPFTQPANSDAETFIQWKGTEVCLDFRCPCGAHGHLDDSFAYFVLCPSCDTVYELGTAVMVKRNDDGRDQARVLTAVMVKRNDDGRDQARVLDVEDAP